MAALRYSSGAEADLENIVDYSLRTWGAARTIRYVAGIENCCDRLAGNPMLGRACDEIRPGLRRMEGRHVIFYRRQENGIRVSRILHQAMAPASRFMDDEP